LEPTYPVHPHPTPPHLPSPHPTPPTLIPHPSLTLTLGEAPKSFYNEFSWSQKANMLFLEQPKGE